MKPKRITIAKIVTLKQEDVVPAAGGIGTRLTLENILSFSSEKDIPEEEQAQCQLKNRIAKLKPRGRRHPEPPEPCQ